MDKEEIFGLFVILTFLIPYTIAGALLRPIFYLFDRRKYRYPYNPTGYDPLGLWYPFCILHYALNEDAWCPNCGVEKQDLIKSKRSEL